MISAFRQFIGQNAMMAYLVMMAPRLVELRRVLKPTGSAVPTLRPHGQPLPEDLLDAVFGKQNFRNEIVWQRTARTGNGGARRWGPIHDCMLFYSATEDYRWNRIYQDYDP